MATRTHRERYSVDFMLLVIAMIYARGPVHHVLLMFSYSIGLGQQKTLFQIMMSIKGLGMLPVIWSLVRKPQNIYRTKPCCFDEFFRKQILGYSGTALPRAQKAQMEIFSTRTSVWYHVSVLNLRESCSRLHLRTDGSKLHAQHCYRAR